MPARKFFKAALNRLRARVLKRGKAAGVSDEARHKLRIALKNLRYGVDFFAICLANGKRRQAYKKQMSALQDLLGIRNDIVGAKTYLKELREEIGPEAERILSSSGVGMRGMQPPLTRQSASHGKNSNGWNLFLRIRSFHILSQCALEIATENRSRIEFNVCKRAF